MCSSLVISDNQVVKVHVPTLLCPPPFLTYDQLSVAAPPRTKALPAGATACSTCPVRIEERGEGFGKDELEKSCCCCVLVCLWNSCCCCCCCCCIPLVIITAIAKVSTLGIASTPVTSCPTLSKKRTFDRLLGVIKGANYFELICLFSLFGCLFC